MNAEPSPGRSLFVFTLLLALLVAFVAAGVLVQRHSSCEAMVDSRAGQRAMWLYVLETADPSDARVDRFAAELDRRIPPLACHGWLGSHAEPIKE